MPARRNLLLALGVLLAGCSFRPMLRQVDDTGVQSDLAAVEVKTSTDRLGYLVRDNLLDELNPTGAEVPTRYVLQVNLQRQSNALAIQLDNTATRFNLSGHGALQSGRCQHSEGRLQVGGASDRELQRDPGPLRRAGCGAGRREARRPRSRHRNPDPARDPLRPRSRGADVKLAGQPLERFLRRPGPDLPVALVYGPDQGLVRERVERLLGAVLEDPKDPFRLSELAADVLRTDPGRLLDEARALCLVGGRRVVRVRQAGDQATAACRALLGLEAIEALILIDAGELGPSSSLRRLVEGAPKAAAIACYRDEGRDLGALVDRLLAEHDLQVEPDARAYLVEHLGADRGITRSEIAKLALYFADPADRRPAPRVTLEAAAQVVGDSAALDLDDLVHAAALGDSAPGRALPRPPAR